MSHTENCEEIGFGVDEYGKSGFGGAIETAAGGPLPVEPVFDIYCLDSCGPMAAIFTHPEVTQVGDVTQFDTDPVTFDLFIRSGGTYPTSNARILIDVPIPQAFTYEATLFLQEIPKNFGSLLTNHIFIGGFDAQGNSAGLFISEIGLLYTGAVHHNMDSIVVDSPLQALPDSAALIEKNAYYVVRIVTSFDTGTTYIYWTKKDDILLYGHQLRYVLPAIKSETAAVVPADSTLISVRGTAAEPSLLAFDTMCLGTGLIIPNIAPRANAGVDQAVRTCAIVQLDGSASFDPEGSDITYRWRLVDAPPTSQYIASSLDGLTYPELVPTGFTDKFYSADLAQFDADETIVAGDVLITDGEAYNISSTGIDGNGFYVQITSPILPDSFSGVAFSLLRQRGISGPTTVKPTFLPDKTGLFKFDLTVYDGALYSEPAVVIVNVTESVIPRGLTPDCRFLWGYLSDFWKLVEDKERIEVFWSGLAQVAAAELLNLWQLEYSKSLRDVQRTWQRRWLRYDTFMEEDPLRIEQSTMRAVYGGVTSVAITDAGIPAGSLDILIGDQSYSIALEVASMGSALLVAAELATQLTRRLSFIDRRIKVQVIDGASVFVRIDAPYYFKVKDSTSVACFTVGAENTYPQGNGLFINSRTYRVDKSLIGLDVKEGDFLVLGDNAYRIARVVSDTLDPYTYQRVTTIDEMPTESPLTWSISGQLTSKTLDFWNGFVCTNDIVLIDVVNTSTGEITLFKTRALGASSASKKILGLDTTAFGSYLLDSNYGVYLRGVIRRKYLPVDSLVVDVPYLQEKIRSTNDEEILRRNVDYFLERFRNGPCIRFITGTPDVWQGEEPPYRLWAETTYLDNRPMIEANFGIPAGFTLDNYRQLSNNVDYLSAVRGLWFAYFNGPTVFNLRAGVQILLGLPFAEEEGIIEEIRNDFSSTSGRILVRDKKTREIVRSYSYPAVLELEVNPDTNKPYAIGDTVKQFAPIVKGTEVLDYVNTPRWIEGYLAQGSMFEPEKFFKFLVRVDAAAFNLPALLFAQQFVKRIKPTYTNALFVVQSKIRGTEVSVSDDVAYRAKLTMFAGPFFGADGQAQMWDQPRPGGGGYWNHYDQANPNAPFVNPTSPIDWGFGDAELSPEEVPVSTLRTVWPGGIPTADSIFYAGLPVFATVAAGFVRGGFKWILPAPGVLIGNPVTSTFTGTANKLVVYFRGVGDGQLLTLNISVNAGVVQTVTFTIPYVDGDPNAYRTAFNFNVNVPLVAGDVVDVRLYHPTGFNTYVESFGAFLGDGMDWSPGVALPAATYALPVAL
jgi:hypothetical protein